MNKVLIVEDNREDLDTLTAMLKNENYELLIAQTGEKAFEILEGHDIDLVILDVLIPDMSGIEICKKIRCDERYSQIPVIFYSIVNSDDDRIIGLEVGAADFLSKSTDPREVVFRIRNLLMAKSSIDALMKCSVKDSLTELYNRMYFMHRVEDEAQRSIRYKREFCCAIVDVDNFNNLNEKFGYVTGDNILKKIGVLLEENIRSADILCRYSGDKFAWLLPETEIEDAYLAIERMRNYILTKDFGDNINAIGLTISSGVSSFNYAQCRVKELFYQVGEALKQAKVNGRNQIIVFRGDK